MTWARAFAWSGRPARPWARSAVRLHAGRRGRHCCGPGRNACVAGLRYRAAGPGRMGAADAMGAIGAVWMQPAEPRCPAPGAQAVRAAGGRAAPGHGPGLWRRMHQLCAAQPACQPPCAPPDRRGSGRGGARGHCGGTLGGDGGGRAGRAQVGRGLCAPGPRLSGRAPGPHGRGQRHGLPAHAVPPGACGGRSREGAGPGCHRRDAGARPQPRRRRAWRMPGLCDLHLGLHRPPQGRGHLPPLPGRTGAAGRRLCRAVAAGPRAAVRHAEFRWLHRAAVRAAGGRRGHGAAGPNSGTAPPSTGNSWPGRSAWPI